MVSETVGAVPTVLPEYDLSIPNLSAGFVN